MVTTAGGFPIFLRLFCMAIAVPQATSLAAATSAVRPTIAPTTPTPSSSSTSSDTANALDLLEPLPTNQVVTRVAVAGATGRVGRWVIQELLDRHVPQVVGLVRDGHKADRIFANRPDHLEIVPCDLTNEQEIATALQGADAAIWCASGFSDLAEAPVWERLKRFFNLAVKPKQSIDAIGLPAFAKSLLQQQQEEGGNRASFGPLPKLVMLSSAGVTRGTWDTEKKARLSGAAEIPIVRLNPFGILDIKRESEQTIRDSGIDYCIFRPCGLNDKCPAGSRPVFSQGDVAVGRINRQDVAKVLVDVLSTPEATGKTFEAVGLAGYPPAVSIRPALSRLRKDVDGPVPDEEVSVSYAIMQQLLPGEQQDSANIAMGQSYEQLDKGEEGRLGKRGKEKVSSLVLQNFVRRPSSSSSSS